MKSLIRQPFAAMLFSMALLWGGGCVPDDPSGGSNASDPASAQEEAEVELDENGCEILRGSVTLRVNGIAVDLRTPEGTPTGDLLLLPAWDETRDAWCLRSRICSKALKKGYRLILPEMGKSMYADKVYPETREDWRHFPVMPWLEDTLIPTLQERFCLLKPNGNNFVIGGGAGARGAVRLVQRLPDLFVAAAALSGDYNPSLFPNDNVYRGVFGDYEANPKRWEEAENLAHNVGVVRTPLFLGHGIADDFVPVGQSDFLYNNLRAQNPSLNVELHLVPDKGYGYAFWNSQITEIFRFFEATQAARPETP